MANYSTELQKIIWVECMMAYKGVLEALDRMLKNLRNNQYLFEGTMILLAGDFCQRCQ